jgi:hypothetical protein
MTFRLIRRSEWGARHDDGTGWRALPATQAWLHHSVTIAPDLLPPFDDDYAAIRALEQIGEERFGAGISYTRLITPAGLIFEGHSISRIGTHTGGRNRESVGYCLVGNYDAHRVNPRQFLALVWCIQEDYRRSWLDAPKLDGGHRDLKSTACPGRYAYDLIDEVNNLASGPTVADPIDTQEDEDLDYTEHGWLDFTRQRVGGMMPQRYYKPVPDSKYGEIQLVPANESGAIPATVLDQADGNYLAVGLQKLTEAVQDLAQKVDELRPPGSET